ncbi:MAG: prolyl oligopeptidase family serine peptidase, partial [Myxococcota bacterium]|nr:prolyl oligopeptidase family serine peptidase [Myxococcota bacterium]
LQNKNGDASRVFVAGHSSGGMMTNVLIGSYPDVFKAGAAFAGVAFGCYAIGSVDSTGWNSSCANGNVTQTGAQWGDMVRAAYPVFSGTRPRIQLWHGTLDAIVNFHNFGEEIKEWTNVLGVGPAPTSTENNAIQTGWIRTRYADASGVVQVEAIQETGQPHNLVVDQAEAIHFFGLDGTSSVPDAGAREGGTDPHAGAGDSGGATDASGSGSGGGSGAVGTGNGGTMGGADSGGQLANSGSSGASGSDGSTDSDGGGTTSSGAAAGSGADGSMADVQGNAAGHSSGCSIARGTGQGTGAERDGRFWLLLVAAVCWNARRRRGRG